MNKTSLLLGILIILGSFFSCSNKKANQDINVLTKEEQADGWQLLFNGKDLKGWHSYLKKEPENVWIVQNGNIVLKKDTTKEEDDIASLTSDQEFENFDLKFEWKIKPCTNSGVFFYVKEDPKYRHAGTTGPEMQIVDLYCSPDSRILKSRAGALYGLIDVDEEPVTPGGQWNQYEIRSNDGHLQLFVNGTKVIETQLWDENWKALISESEKSDQPDFGTFHKGHIAFQGSEPGTKIWFRNIKVKIL